MKKALLILLVILLHSSSCEVLELTFKQVDYVVDGQEEYVYVTQLSPNEVDISSSFLDRSSFDIPIDADIEKFLVKNIYLNIDVLDDNICDEIFIVYAYDILEQGSSIDGSARVDIDLPDNFVEDLLINNNFTEPFTNIRLAISEAIKTGNGIEFQVRTGCYEADTTDIIITVVVQIIAEYTACEELPEATDLPDC